MGPCISLFTAGNELEVHIQKEFEHAISDAIYWTESSHKQLISRLLEENTFREMETHTQLRSHYAVQYGSIWPEMHTIDSLSQFAKCVKF